MFCYIHGLTVMKMNVKCVLKPNFAASAPPTPPCLSRSFYGSLFHLRAVLSRAAEL